MDEVRLIEIKEDILADNKDMAAKIREQLKNSHTYLLNLMASPGAGKTSLIMKTIEQLRGHYRIGVIEADIDSMVDAEKVAAMGVKAVQLRTGGFCHLDAAMVSTGLAAFDLNAFDLIIIENVGNLVCPAEFDTGAIHNAMILSVPEGDDKPLKYPLMFSVSNVLVVNKIDYMGLSDFNMAVLKERVKRINPAVAIFEVSSKTGEGIKAWADWLEAQVSAFLK
ncbi:MAG: hydrogenase nickel incorporation protein HypB [Smithella sp.]|jgi:hydrogenase nickel incorporation protein HypB